jgi:pyridinium-3,5-bisthiocarboxylic acid mononucleotide nickel chelatase
MLIAYIDCFAGLSAESLLDALISAGLPRAEVGGSILDSLDIQVKDVSVLADFGQAISASTLPALVKQVTHAVIARLQEAEGAVYTSEMRSIFQVTGRREWDLEELGALVSVVRGLALLGIDRLECSPLQVGGGSLEMDDGAERKLVSALSPVTAELLRAGSIPVYGSAQIGELVTPVGVALVATLSSKFGPLPSMKIRSIGYGTETTHNRLSGTLDSVRPGALPRETRLFIGDAVVIEKAPVSAAVGATSHAVGVSAMPRIEAERSDYTTHLETIL